MIRNASEPIPSTREDEERQQRELPVEHEQDHRRADQRQRRAEQRHDAVGDELVERLHVVGQARDDHARLAARVEADRQRLQVREELDPQVLQHALADPADEVGLRVGRAPVDERGGEERDARRGRACRCRRGRCRRRSRAWPAAAGRATRRCRRPARANISAVRPRYGRSSSSSPRSLRPRPPVERQRRTRSSRRDGAATAPAHRRARPACA